MSRASRWEDLNTALSSNSSLGWCYIEGEWPLVLWNLEPNQKGTEKASKLYEEIMISQKHFLYYKDVDWYHITQILVAICQLFRDDPEKVYVHVNERKEGVHIETQAKFDFVLHKGKKRVIVLQAMDYNMEERLVDAVVSCEILADTENVPVVYAVVTNLRDWHFLKSNESYIQHHQTCVGHFHTPESVGEIIGKLYSILVEA